MGQNRRPRCSSLVARFLTADWGLLASCWFSDVVQFCQSLNGSGGSQDFFSSFTELRHLSTVQLGYQLPAAQLPSPLHPQPRRGDPPQQCLQHHLRLGEGGREDNRWVLKLRQTNDGLSPLFFTGFFLFAAQLSYPPNVNSPFFSLSLWIPPFVHVCLWKVCHAPPGTLSYAFVHSIHTRVQNYFFLKSDLSSQKDYWSAIKNTERTNEGRGRELEGIRRGQLVHLHFTWRCPPDDTPFLSPSLYSSWGTLLQTQNIYLEEFVIRIMERKQIDPLRVPHRCVCYPLLPNWEREKRLPCWVDSDVRNPQLTWTQTRHAGLHGCWPTLLRRVKRRVIAERIRDAAFTTGRERARGRSWFHTSVWTQAQGFFPGACLIQNLQKSV